MRREIDELFGDVFERDRPRAARGFSPSVDVYYADDPPRAVVKADLAGRRHRRRGARDPRPPAADRRRAPPAGGRRAASTSRSRSSTARSGALVELGADVVAEQAQRDATRTASCGSRCRSPAREETVAGCRSRAARRPRRAPSEHRHPGERRARPASRPSSRTGLPDGAAGAAAARQRPLPGHAHAARDRPGALDPARQRRAGRQPDAGDGRLARPRGRGARARTTSTTWAWRASSRA